MRLFDWWLRAPESIGPKVPMLVKAILVPWVLIGFVVAAIPDLQQIPPLVHVIIGVPAALVVLWFAVGMLLRVVDALIRLGTFVVGRIGKAQ